MTSTGRTEIVPSTAITAAAAAMVSEIPGRLEGRSSG